MNDTQYTKYLFDSVKKISFANPGVIRDTYGKGENLTHDFLIKAAEGKVFIYSETEKPEPEPEKPKTYNIYGEFE